MKRERDMMERLRKFDELSDAQKSEVRMAWLEQKMVGVLWLLISISSMLIAGIVAWIIGGILDSRSNWLLVPVFVFTWLVAGWWAQRQVFRGSPPHIDFVDPDI